MAFLGQEELVRAYQDRFRFLYAAVFIAVGILITRLTFLQILNGDKLRQYSEENRIKRVKIAAPRGMMFDRDHRLLVDNRPAFDLEITPQYLHESKKTKEVITQLAKILKWDESDIYDILEKNSTQPTFMPVKIKNDLTRDEVAEIELWRISMPGVQVSQEIKRTNIDGEVGAHLLGYIGEINQTELPKYNLAGSKYKLGDSVGKFGLEQKLEDIVRGIDGEKLVEVDALGRTKLDKKQGRILSADAEKQAVPGKNLVLTIDEDLQKIASQAFGDKAGSLVAIEPKTGQILAMVSRPAFDPTEFSRGIPASIWNKLLNDEKRPLRDKSIQDHYPPGSVFKVVTAIAALEEGTIDENTTFTCTGKLMFGNKLRHCHLKRGHGSISVVKALTQSCDVFFYRAAMSLKSVDDIAKWAVHLGLGRKTGIPLDHEVAGLIPTEAWKQKRYNEPWNPGDTLSIGIGQSYLLVTGIQLANLYASIANGGTLFRPSIVQQTETYDGDVLKEMKPEVLDTTRLKPKTIELLKKGLWGVINSPGGTAYSQRLPGMDFVGKTGSVQVINISADKIYQKCENMRYRDRHNAMFAGFAPADDPAIAVAVIGEHACHGGTGAAPIARAVIKAYLEKRFPEKYSAKAIAERLKEEKKNPKITIVPKAADESETEDLIPSENDTATPAGKHEE